MSLLHHYKRIENDVTDTVKRDIARFGNLIWRRLHTAFALGRQRMTLMLVPDSEQKIVSFRFSLFSVVFGVVLLAGVLSVLVIVHQESGGMARLLSSSTRKLASSQANLELLQNRIGRLEAVSHVLQTAMNKTIGTLHLPGPKISGSTGHGGETVGADVTDIKNLTAMMSNSIVRLRRIAYFYKSHVRLLAELPTKWPVEGGRGIITTNFGPAIHPFTHRMYLHMGIDIAYHEGTPIVSAANGKVVQIGYQPLGYGNFVLIRHQFGYFTKYAHLERVFVHEGEKVKQGQIIGRMGNTGLSTGPHLHFEIHLGNQVIDPMSFLDIGHKYHPTLVSQD